MLRASRFGPRLHLPQPRFLLAIALWGVVSLAWAGFNVAHGLHATYFETTDWTGPVVMSGLDARISTGHLTQRWAGTVPPTFSVQWSGYLAVPRAGNYTFATTSDDGSWLYVDGQLVVRNGGRHSAITRTGRIPLSRGPHYVVLRYFQAGGPYAIRWLWARDPGALSPVPSWLLTPVPHTYAEMLTGRVLGWLWWPCAMVVLFFCPRSLWTRTERTFLDGPRHHPAVACLVLFAALAILETWPLATNPAHLSRNDNADTELNEWVLAWDVHQAVHDPLHLYDANIFYPEHDTLAYSESMIVQAAMGAPLLWLGASPVLTYNLLLLLGFTLTGWAMCLVVARWTGDWIAGLASGVFMAFNAHVLTRLPHMQIQHVEFFPLALLSLDLLLTDPRLRHAVWLAVWYTLQALTSVYLLVFVAVALVVAALARPEDWLGRRGRRLWPFAALAAGLAAAALLPYLWPYWVAFHDQGLSRTVADIQKYAASWRDYLSTPANYDYQLWSHRWFSGTALFPGWAALILAGVAVAGGVAFRDRRARMCLAFGVCGVALSFGGRLPGYVLLYRFVPIFRGIRAPARFGYLGIVAVAVLAGFGTALLRRRLTNGTVRALASAAILIVAVMETLAAPIYYSPFDHIPAIYGRLRHAPHAIVAEFPFYSSVAIFHGGRYLLDSTRNWRPMLNGYSGFVPGSYDRHFEALRSFPSASSVGALQAAGVTDIFVRLWKYNPTDVARMDRSPGLHLVTVDAGDDIALYAVKPVPGGAPHAAATAGP